MIGMRVGIIGGGIGGLLSGVKILGSVDADLYEEHVLVGYPKHCTGLISDEVLSHLGCGAKNYVLNAFREYTLIHSSRPNKELELKFRNTIYLVDRPSLERYLSDEFQCRGGMLHLGLKVTSIDLSETSLAVKGGLTKKYDVIIIAEGARATLTRASGMCGGRTYLVGLQALIRCRNVLESPYVIFGNDVSKEFFGWVVPVNERRLIFGLADRYVSYVRLNHLMKTYLTRMLEVNDLVVEEVFGGLIPTSTPCKQTLKNFVGIGDAVSVVKPLSGGGIYSISRQVRALEESLKANTPDNVLKKYRSKSSGMIKTLNVQHMLRKYIIRKFHSLSNFIMKLIDLEVDEVHILDYDRYLINPLNLNIKDALKILSTLLI
ncbi:MAG: NAD(P)/FAD-dependent oxidoreductase [Sulfolobales archaeon]